jgi:hypothetical protein
MENSEILRLRELQLEAAAEIIEGGDVRGATLWLHDLFAEEFLIEKAERE